MTENIHLAINKRNHEELKAILLKDEFTRSELCNIMHNCYEEHNIEAFEIIFNELCAKHETSDFTEMVSGAIAYAVQIASFSYKNEKDYEINKFCKELVHFIFDNIEVFSDQQRSSIASSCSRNMFFCYHEAMHEIFDEKITKKMIKNLSLSTSNIEANLQISKLFEYSGESLYMPFLTPQYRDYILNSEDMSDFFSKDIIKSLFYTEEYDSAFKLLNNFKPNTNLLRPEEAPLFAGIICQLLSDRGEKEVKNNFLNTCMNLELLNNKSYKWSVLAEKYMSPSNTPYFYDYFNSNKEFVLKTHYSQNSVLFNSCIKYEAANSQKDTPYSYGQFALIEKFNDAPLTVSKTEAQSLDEQGIIFLEQHLIKQNLASTPIDLNIKKHRL